jgi:hypothetical protein
VATFRRVSINPSFFVNINKIDLNYISLFIGGLSKMTDDKSVPLPFGVPFIGGSDDPSEIVGTESSEGGDDSSSESKEDN